MHYIRIVSQSRSLWATFEDIMIKKKGLALTKEGIVIEGRKVDAQEFANEINAFTAEFNRNNPDIMHSLGGVMQGTIGFAEWLTGMKMPKRETIERPLNRK